MPPRPCGSAIPCGTAVPCGTAALGGHPRPARRGRRSHTEINSTLCTAARATQRRAHTARKRSTRKKLVAEMQDLRKRFRRLWLARNRRSEIDLTLKRYAASLKGLK